MNPVLIDRLGRIASLAFQRRFMTTTNKDRYVLPEEILEDAVGLASALMDNLAEEDRSPSTTAASLVHFATVVEREASLVPLDGSISNEELIERNPAWLAIRGAAMECMNALGVDLDSWERLRG